MPTELDADEQPTRQVHRPHTIRLYDRHFALLWSGTPDEFTAEMVKQAEQLRAGRRFTGHISIDGTAE